MEESQTPLESAVETLGTSLDLNDRLINQLAALRVIADRVALIAISDGDMTGLSIEDAKLIDQYLSQTSYLGEGDAGDLELDLIQHVIKPLLMPVPSTAEATAANSSGPQDDSPPLVDYISLSQREMARKVRMRDELSQLKVLRESILASAKVPSDRWIKLLLELDVARTALLFASSDALERPLLMSMSPAVRLAEKIGRLNSEVAATAVGQEKPSASSAAAATIDWADVGHANGAD